MSNLRTIALIFAVGLIVNFLHGAFFGIGEEIASEPPSSPAEITKESDGIQYTVPQTPDPPEATEDDLFEDNSALTEDEDDYFDEVVEPEGYQHKQQDSHNFKQRKRGGKQSQINTVFVQYCTS